MGAKATPSGTRCKCGHRFLIREHLAATRQQRDMTCPDCGRKYQPSDVMATKQVAVW